ncbi:AMP-binding protein, partial [Catellatospora methionotrophica]|uniref:AMP-binding protein n=1 Tax=Catellatospora methionotrophica TaxID=121620 RepID=UPI0033DAB1B5
MATPTLLDLARASTGTVVVDGARLAAADLVAAARPAAAALHERGVRPGDGVLLVDDGSGADLLAAMLGVWWVGGRASVLPAGAQAAHRAAVLRQTGAVLTVSA